MQHEGYLFMVLIEGLSTSIKTGNPHFFKRGVRSDRNFYILTKRSTGRIEPVNEPVFSAVDRPLIGAHSTSRCNTLGKALGWRFKV
jgi:hypothetical protein